MIGSLTARIFAIFWLTLALVLMLVLMLPKLDSRQMTELLDSEQRQGLMIEQHVEAELANDPPNDLMWWRRLFRAIDKWAPPGQRLLLVTTEGRVIGAERSEMQIIRNFIGQADNADHPQKKKYGRVELVGPFSVRDGEDNYQLYLIRPASSSQSDFINLLFDRPLLLLIVTMLVSTPLLLWLAWSLAKPARKLKNAADEVAQGNLRQHPELEAGPQEFLAAGASFNQMVTALERMMTSQQRLLSDISHELRTPLTSIRGWVETLMTLDDPTDENYRKGLEIINNETGRLNNMVEELLDFSRLQNGRIRMECRPLDLVAELTDAVLFCEARIRQEGLLLHYTEPEEMIPVYADPDRLRQVFINILDNAIKYSAPGGRITVKLWAGEYKAFVEIIDQGRGIPPEDLENVKTKFYKGSNSVRGSGIGLALVDSIMTALDGTLDIKSTLGRGTVVTLGLLLYHKA